jgi:hypothetical protein
MIPTETDMERRNELYLGWQLDVAVDGDETHGFFIALQSMRYTTIGSPINVPIPAAQFSDASAAFTDAFERLQDAVDNYEGTPR